MSDGHDRHSLLPATGGDRSRKLLNIPKGDAGRPTASFKNNDFQSQRRCVTPSSYTPFNEKAIGPYDVNATTKLVEVAGIPGWPPGFTQPRAGTNLLE
jgi:hypothetical protein